MKTLLVNLKHAARNGQYVHIGGGRFTPSEIVKAVVEIDAVVVELGRFIEYLGVAAGDDAYDEEIKRAVTLLEKLK